MTSLLQRWASLGIHVAGEINPLEDPETLLSETIQQIGEEGRFVEFVATWLSRFGHLLLTKKLKFQGERERRVFSALIEESGSKEEKLIRLIQRPRQTDLEFVFPDLVPSLQEISRKDPNPNFLKQGLILKKYPLVREDILFPNQTVFQRSAILRSRAIYGPTLRSDLAAVMPGLKATTVRRLAQKLHVAWQTLAPIIESLERSGLVRWTRRGRHSTLEWIGLETVGS